MAPHHDEALLPILGSNLRKVGPVAEAVRSHRAGVQAAGPNVRTHRPEWSPLGGREPLPTAVRPARARTQRQLKQKQATDRGCLVARSTMLVA
eukprot:SAG31_NODE_1516_length_8036_cov_2.800680_2_plen_93_part_00